MALNTSKIKVGDIIKDYDAMCLLLEDDYIEDVAVRRAQYKEWKLYFDFERKGKKFVVKEVYPKKKTPIKNKTFSREMLGGTEKWDELYEFVRKDVLGLSQNERIARNMVLRLEGLSKGNFMASNKLKPMGYYQYEDILITYKLALTMTRGVNFKNLEHKFAYITKVVEGKINDIVLARRRQEKINEEIETMNVDNQYTEPVQFNSKKTNKKPEKRISEDLKALW